MYLAIKFININSINLKIIMLKNILHFAFNLDLNYN